MDEILDYIKQIHLKHKALAVSLVVTEVLGIFALIWYLREPLTQNFLTNPPKAYSIESYETKKRYLIKQGDFLHGSKALPFSKIAVFITPGEKTIIQADKKGDFSFQVPKNVKKGIYRLTFANYDAAKNIAWIKSYKVRIDSNSIFNLKNWNLKTANAQEHKLAI